jgi:type VI protein secretion system component VasK
MADVASAEPTTSPWKDAIAAILGVLILIAFAIFIWFLLRNLDLSETQWARAIYLFAGVEAVAFTAAGYFFGTQVQRGRVEEAKAEAQAAEQVKEAAEETARSERRASKVLAEGVVASATSTSGGLLGDADPASSALVAQARALLQD